MTTVLSDVDSPTSVDQESPARSRSGHPSFGEAPSRWRGGLAAARRHTALVRILRGSALAISVIAAGIVLSGALLAPSRQRLGELSAERVAFDGTKITLESPKISGYQPDRRPYSIKARVGVQDLSNPQIIELLDIDAGIGTADEKTMQVSASRARYDSQSEQVSLDGNVRISSAGGYDLALQAARVDFNTGTLVSDTPVSLRLDGATVDGERMTIDDHRHVVSFDGGVKSSIDPAPAKEADRPVPPASSAR